MVFKYRFNERFVISQSVTKVEDGTYLGPDEAPLDS